MRPPSARPLPPFLPLRSRPSGSLASGGSRVVAPDGSERAALDGAEEGLVTAEIDRATLSGERQNFDAAGHYYRSDVFDLRVDRRRLVPVTFDDEPR